MVHDVPFLSEDPYQGEFLIFLLWKCPITLFPFYKTPIIRILDLLYYASVFSWSPTHKKPRSQQKLVCPLLVCPHPRVQDGQGLAAKAHLVPCSGRLGYPLSCPSSPEKWSLTWRSSVSVSVLGLVFLRIIFLIHLGLRPWKKGGIKWLPSLRDTEVFSPSLARIFGQISQLRPCRCILCELEPYGSWGSSPQYSEPSRTGVRLLSPISK